MSISNRIITAYRHLGEGDYENALIQAIIAMDGSAKKEGIGGGNADRCKSFLTNNRDIISCVAMKGRLINLGSMKFPYTSRKGKEESKTLEEIIYHIIRCDLLHEGEMSYEVEFTNNQIGSSENGKVLLPLEIVSGIFMAVVGSEANKDIKLNADLMFHVNDKNYLFNDFLGRKLDLIRLYRPDYAQ